MPGVGVEKVGLLLRTRMDQKLGHKTFLMVFNSGRLTWAFSVKILRARKNSSAAKLIFF